MNRNLDPETPQEKEEEKLGFQNNGFNQYCSDRIPLDREVPDTRDPRCVCVCVHFEIGGIIHTLTSN